MVWIGIFLFYLYVYRNCVETMIFVDTYLEGALVNGKKTKIYYADITRYKIKSCKKG